MTDHTSWMSKLARSRIAIAVTAAATAAALAAPAIIYATEGKSPVDLSDSLPYRLPQMVNITSKAMPAAGTGATASVNGNDAIGQVNITTGTKTGTGSLIHVTFKTPYKVQPFVYVTPEDAPPPAEWYVTIDWNGFDIWVGVPPKQNTNYPFNYLVAARPWSMYLGPSGQPVDQNGQPSQY